MKARQLLKERQPVGGLGFVELVVWHLPQPAPPSTHVYKYRLAFVVDGVCVVRYDNERGKGDHRHVGGVEFEYAFTTASALLADFWADVGSWENPS